GRLPISATVRPEVPVPASPSTTPNETPPACTKRANRTYYPIQRDLVSTSNLRRARHRAGAQSRERLQREDHLDRHLEVVADPQGQVQARAELAALQIADGLVVHAERVGELPPGDPALGPEHGDPVVRDLAAH